MKGEGALALRLSAIDLQSPDRICVLATLLEDFGYHRMWLTEHHTATQSASPAVLAGIVAARTHRMRVGSAGVMLRYYAPLKIAEDFRLLATLFPGRLDLGVVGGRASPPKVDSALLDGKVTSDEDYARRVRTLVALCRDEPSDVGTIPGPVISGESYVRPQLWLGSLSRTSAILAGQCGMSFAYNVSLLARGDDATEVVQNYRQSFHPAADSSSPYVAVVCYGTCADSEEEAMRLFQATMGRSYTAGSTPTMFAGTAEQCRCQLLELATLLDADEIVIQQFAPTFSARVHGYELLAEAIGTLRT